MNSKDKLGSYICNLIETQKHWKKIFEDDMMIYLYAMTGFGKTSQALAFADNEYREWVRISASDENFFDEIEDVEKKYERTRSRVLIILDDLQWIFAKGKRQRLFEVLLMLQKNKKLNLFLISRASVPEYLTPLLVTRQMSVDNQSVLEFDEEHIKELLLTYNILRDMPRGWQDKIVKECMKKMQGYPIGSSTYFMRLEKNIGDPHTAYSLAVQDIFAFLRIHLFGEWTNYRSEAAIRLSVYREFDKKMADCVLGEQADVVLKDFMEVGSFINFKAPDTYWFHPFFREFLEHELLIKSEKIWLPLYEEAGRCYEDRRNFEDALRCYKIANRQDKIVEIVIYLSENAEGCSFARIASEYINDISPEWEVRQPQIVGAKVMLAAYKMDIEECMNQLERLKKMADDERDCVMQGGAVAAYVRTAIACPYDTADKLKDNMLYYLDYVRQNGFHLNNIMPTGNMPSLINGGLDLLPWEKNKKLIYPVVKKASEILMGKEAIGIADAAMGEMLYEQNYQTKAMAYLTKALSAANFNGSIRVQYSATAIMARVFQAEGQSETAKDILNNLLEKAELEKYNELIPNINATVVHCQMLEANYVAMQEWLYKYAPDEHGQFFITVRYQLLTKARVLSVFGNTIEALFILNILEKFADKYKRTYFQIEILVLKAIILYRRDEQWEETLIEAVRIAKPYKLVRVFADQGAAFLPLLKEVEWEKYEVNQDRLKVVIRQTKRMAAKYPGYLKEKRQFGELSKKEKEVLKLMSEGLNNSSIAESLGINLGTAKFHVGNIMKKLDAENRTVAVKIAQEEGLI